MAINKVMLTGNLTRDPELLATQGGTSILSFSIAVNARRRNQNGEWEDYANFFDLKAFGRRAEALARILEKGTKVAVEGKLSQRTWDDRETGQRRSKVEVVVDELELMSRQNGSGDDRQSEMGSSPFAPMSETDIPF